jgi:hypothetical protein
MLAHVLSHAVGSQRALVLVFVELRQLRSFVKQCIHIMVQYAKYLHWAEAMCFLSERLGRQTQALENITRLMTTSGAYTLSTVQVETLTAIQGGLWSTHHMMNTLNNVDTVYPYEFYVRGQLYLKVYEDEQPGQRQPDRPPMDDSDW